MTLVVPARMRLPRAKPLGSVVGFHSMCEGVPAARAALVAGQERRTVVRQAFDESKVPNPDVTILFASAEYSEHFPELLAVAKVDEAPLLVGCSAAGIIGPEQELEGQPAIGVFNSRYRARICTRFASTNFRSTRSSAMALPCRWALILWTLASNRRGLRSALIRRRSTAGWFRRSVSD